MPTPTYVNSYKHAGLEVATVQTPNGPVRVDPGDRVCTLSDGSIVAVKPADYDAFIDEHTADDEPES